MTLVDWSRGILVISPFKVGFLGLWLTFKIFGPFDLTRQIGASWANNNSHVGIYLIRFNVKFININFLQFLYLDILRIE